MRGRRAHARHFPPRRHPPTAKLHLDGAVTVQGVKKVGMRVAIQWTSRIERARRARPDETDEAEGRRKVRGVSRGVSRRATHVPVACCRTRRAALVT